MIVALPTGRFASSKRPSAPVVAVALPIVTDAPSMTAPVAALTTPDTVAVAVGPPGSLPPHAATRIDVARAIASVGIDVEICMRLSDGKVRSHKSSIRHPNQPLPLPRQRIRPELEPVRLARGPFPPLHVEGGAGADRVPETTPLPAGVRVVDPAVQPLGVEPHRVRDAQHDPLPVL